MYQPGKQIPKHSFTDTEFLIDFFGLQGNANSNIKKLVLICRLRLVDENFEQSRADANRFFQARN